MLVSESTVYVVATTVPNFTAETLVKLVPVIVTGVPPSVLPAAGSIDRTIGAGPVGAGVVVVVVEVGADGLPPHAALAAKAIKTIRRRIGMM
jgi:hypothetical protein